MLNVGSTSRYDPYAFRPLPHSDGSSPRFPAGRTAATGINSATRKQQVPFLEQGPHAAQGAPAANDPEPEITAAAKAAATPLRPIRRWEGAAADQVPPPPPPQPRHLPQAGAIFSGRGQMIDIFC